ncbi:MAG: cell division protein ZipA C-terminal FtsZ-binding domain-containing protein [Pseudomonadota bacterium]|nr:hypothetical protein [Gammaproteobacteria bacterium]MBU1628582.1 hypothetical protein [Gammaproteobacteria bacterium]MBU2545881.1 hypothetical protein [Gammaproteobacteria bacterium]
MTKIDLLRAILLGLGIVVVLIIYIDGKRRCVRREKVRIRASKNDEVFDESVDPSQQRLTEQVAYRQEVTPIEPQQTLSEEKKPEKSVSIAPEAIEPTEIVSQEKKPESSPKQQKIKKVDKKMTEPSISLHQATVSEPVIEAKHAPKEEVQILSLKEEPSVKEPQKQTITLDTVAVENEVEKQLFNIELQTNLDSLFKDGSVEKAFPKDKNLMTIGVFASEGKKFGGYELLQAIQANGFYYGDMQIFHHYGHDLTLSKKLFSLASATEPGDFDLNNMGNFFCKGLILFMNIQEHSEPVSVFDKMIDTASQLSDDINGVLVLPDKKAFTKEHVDAIREQILENKLVTH